MQIFHKTFEMFHTLDILKSLTDLIHSFHVTDAECLRDLLLLGMLRPPLLAFRVL